MAAQTDGAESGQASPATTIRNPGDQSAPDSPQTGKTTCPECGGTGRVQNGACPNCGGTGQVTQIVGDA